MHSNSPAHERSAGVLLALSSLPGRHGIGDMGKAAYEFVDLLCECGAKYWQILPVNPLGCGNSPYQPYSSFAGDPIFIDLDDAPIQRLLASHVEPFHADSVSVDYDQVRAFKGNVLREAFERFHPGTAFQTFLENPLMRDYAVFMTFRELHGGKSWTQWPEAFRTWPENRDMDLTPYEKAIEFELFMQYLFFDQWRRLKEYANKKGILIIGDIPFYVGQDSQDVWTGKENFLLDEEGEPAFIAGVPPDYFSVTGQRWGNPIYNWDTMQKDGFSLWFSRMQSCETMFDVVRIDHFRAFDTYWKIPASCPTAEDGAWIEAPGYVFFDALREQYPTMQIIAEDLGYLRKEVLTLRDHYHFRGMKVMEFALKAWKMPDMEQDRTHMIVYTGTHDNQTAKGFFRAQSFINHLGLWVSMFKAGYKTGAMGKKLARMTLNHKADRAILPVQDILGMGDEARMNTPGTIGSPNWEWKLKDFEALRLALPAFSKLLRDSGR